MKLTVRKIGGVFLASLLTVTTSFGLAFGASVGNTTSSSSFEERLSGLQYEFYNGRDLTPEYIYDSSGTCVAYAKRIAYGVFDKKWDKWERYVRTPDNQHYDGVDDNLENLSIGDTLTFSRKDGNVHMIFITGIDGDTIYFTDSNWTDYVNGYKPNTIRWNASLSKSTLLNNQDYYYHNYRHATNYSDIFGNETPPSPTITQCKYPVDTNDVNVILEWTKATPSAKTVARGKGNDTGVYFKAVNGTLPGNGFKIRAVYEDDSVSNWFHITDSKAYVINHNVEGKAGQLVCLETEYPSEWGYNWGNVTIDWSPDFTEQSGVTNLY